MFTHGLCRNSGELLDLLRNLNAWIGKGGGKHLFSIFHSHVCKCVDITRGDGSKDTRSPHEISEAILICQCNQQECLWPNLCRVPRFWKPARHTRRKGRRKKVMWSKNSGRKNRAEGRELTRGGAFGSLHIHSYLNQRLLFSVFHGWFCRMDFYFVWILYSFI